MPFSQIIRYRVHILPLSLSITCCILILSGCGGGERSEGDAAADDETVQNKLKNVFAPGGKKVKTGAGASNPSRFDLPIKQGKSDTDKRVNFTRPDNPNAGVGLGNVVGIAEYWKTHGRHFVRTPESEFERLNEAPDSLPPFDWTVKADPPDYDIIYEPKIKNQRISIPKGSQRSGPSDIIFASVPSGVVAVGQHAGIKDKREVWNLMTSEKIGTIQGLGVSTIMNAISPDGRYFAGVTKDRAFDKTIGIWDVLEKKVAVDIPLGSAPWLKGIAIPRPDVLVAGYSTGDYALRAWRLPSGESLFDIESSWGGRELDSPVFSPGGHYVATVQRSDEHWTDVITIYNLDTGLPEGELDLPAYDIGWWLRIQGLAFSRDGKELAALIDGWYCSKVIIWNMEDGSIASHMTSKKKLKLETLGDSGFRTATPLIFFPGNRRLLAYEVGVLDRDVGAGIWKLPAGELRNNFPRNRWPLDESHVTIVATKGRTGTVQVYELPEEQISEVRKKMSILVAREPSVPVSLARPGLPSVANSTQTKHIAPKDIEWNVLPDAASAGPSPSGRSIQLATPRGTIRQVVVPQKNAGRAFVLRSSAHVPWSRIPLGNVMPQRLITNRWHGKPGDGEEISFFGTSSKPRAWVDVYDTSSGQRVRELRLTYDGDLVSASPDGKAFLVLAAGNSGRLDLYSAEDGSHLSGIQPYDREGGEKSRMVVSAVMPTDSHIISLSGTGKLSAWKIPGAEEIFSAEGTSQPTCSPGGRYVGYSDGEAYYFVELATGELCGKIPDVGQVQSASFHPSGGQLALLSSHKGGYYLFTVNMANGQVQAPFPVPVVSGIMRWFGDRHILLDNQKLVDVQQKTVAWSYELPAGDHLPNGPGNRHWFVANSGGKPLLNSAVLPGNQELTRINRAALTPEFVLQPGDSCSLSFQINHPAFGNGARQRLEKTIRDQLASNRITVSEGRPVTLVISLSEKSGKTLQRKYNSFGIGDDADNSEISIALKTATFRAAFMVNNQVAWKWESHGSNDIWFVSRKKGEPLQQALDRIYKERIQGGFTGVQLPPYVFTPLSANGIGSTQLAPPPKTLATTQ